jgi:hypothetical protein
MKNSRMQKMVHSRTMQDNKTYILTLEIMTY